MVRLFTSPTNGRTLFIYILLCHTAAHSKLQLTLESLWKRALRIIIYSDMDHHTSLFLAELDTPYSRRERLIQRFFIYINETLTAVHAVSTVFYRNNVTLLLNASRTHEPFKTRTERFHNCCIPYCVSNFRG